MCISCNTKEPLQVTQTEKDWVLYTDSIVGFGSFSVNKDKSANSR